MKIKIFILTICLFFFEGNIAQAQYYGQYSNNQFAPNSVSNQFGEYGSPYSPNSINNPYNSHNFNNQFNHGNNGKTYKLYDSNGNFRGNLNNNRFDPDSVANPYGRYGSRFSSESINNPYGAGNRFNDDSPFNQFGDGMEIRLE